MKLTITALILIFNSNFLFGQQNTQVDSIVFNDKGEVIVQILKSTYRSQYKYYRFYNSSGFLCFTIEKNENGDIVRIQNGEIKKTFYSDVERDPVFLVDTFAIGFTNKTAEMRGYTIVEKVNKTLAFYYSIKDCDNPFYDEFINNSSFTDTTYFGDEMFFVVAGIWPIITDEWLNEFSKKIVWQIAFSKREKRKLNNRLIFEIKVFGDGRINSIQLVNKVDDERQSIIDENIKSLMYNRLRPFVSRRNEGYGIYKFAISIELK